MDQKPNKKPVNKWLQLINIPIQMGFIIFISAQIGNWLNKSQSNTKVNYKKPAIIVGVGLALYNVVRQVKELNKNQ